MFFKRGFQLAAGASAVATWAVIESKREKIKHTILAEAPSDWKSAALEIPTRPEMLNMLKGFSKNGKIREEKVAKFDVLVIGGGATGVGCAVDASLRGLKVALVERDDFASGTFRLA